MSAIDELVQQARCGWRRLSPAEALSEQHRGALLVDTRTDRQRARQGEVPGALVIDRTVLEWRLDPTSGASIPEAADRPRVVVLCSQGFSSSLAAASLRALGVDATDVVGGLEAWLASGLPISDEAPDVRE